jgi:hypothetical protein
MVFVIVLAKAVLPFIGPFVGFFSVNHFIIFDRAPITTQSKFVIVPQT